MAAVIAGGAGWYFWRFSRPGFPLDEIHTVKISKSFGGFGSVDRAALVNLTITKVWEKKDRWAVEFGYLMDGKPKASIFEVIGFNVDDGKYIQFGKDPFPFGPGQKVIVHLTYSDTHGQTSNRKLIDNLGEGGAEIIGNFGDQIIPWEIIENRLSQNKAHFYHREVKVSSIK